MKVAVAQISCSLGDPEANLSKVHKFSRRAKEIGAELVGTYVLPFEIASLLLLAALIGSIVIARE